MGLGNLFDPKKRMQKAHQDLTAEGRALYQDFRALGDVRGMAKDEIIMFCGAPSSFVAMKGGHVARWSRVGFRADLVFDMEDRCKGYSHLSLD